jgi:hypothetical protein
MMMVRHITKAAGDAVSGLKSTPLVLFAVLLNMFLVIVAVYVANQLINRNTIERQMLFDQLKLLISECVEKK